jgi:short-subunit dehydrogenase
MQNNRLFQSAFIASSEEVAKLCYRVCNSDRPIAIHGFGNRLLTWLSRWIPRKLGVRMAGKMVSMPLK